jgi:uncharacterized membrane protein YccC
LGNELVSRKQEAVMPSIEEVRERARGFMVVGWVLVGFAFLILFFEPASIQNGRKWIPGIAAVLFVAGLLLNIYGHRLWRHIS